LSRSHHHRERRCWIRRRNWSRDSGWIVLRLFFLGWFSTAYYDSFILKSSFSFQFHFLFSIRIMDLRCRPFIFIAVVNAISKWACHASFLSSRPYRIFNVVRQIKFKLCAMNDFIFNDSMWWI
jgi:hypothetical protein